MNKKLSQWTLSLNHFTSAVYTVQYRLIAATRHHDWDWDLLIRRHRLTVDLASSLRRRLALQSLGTGGAKSSFNSTPSPGSTIEGIFIESEYIERP